MKVVEVPFKPFGFTAMAVGPIILRYRHATMPVELMLAHERVHLDQQLRWGPSLAYTRYFLSKHWRMRMEAEAYAEEVHWRMDNGSDGMMWVNYYAALINDRYLGGEWDHTDIIQEIVKWMM